MLKLLDFQCLFCDHVFEDLYDPKHKYPKCDKCEGPSEPIVSFSHHVQMPDLQTSARSDTFRDKTKHWRTA